MDALGAAPVEAGALHAPAEAHEPAPCASCCSSAVGSPVDAAVAPEPAFPQAAAGPAPPAFAAFLQASRRPRPSARAAASWIGAGLFHVAVLGWGLCQAFWHVEELAPAQVKVSLLLWSEARVMPPPPPPPAGGPQTPRKPVERLQPTKDLVQPQQTVAQVDPEPAVAAPEPEAAAGGEPGGVEGGVTGGILGAVASPTALAPVAPAAAVLSSAERERLVARYITDVLDRRLKAHLFYPPEAEEDELEGTIWLSVVIDGHGQLVSARVVKGAELGSLSRAALQTVHRAQPFPPPPASLGTRVEVRVPLTYRLAG